MNFAKRAQEVFDLEMEELQKVKTRIGKEIDEVVELIYSSKGKVVVTGIGKTGIIGKKISSSLASTGTPSIFMNAAEAVHGDLGMISRGDVVVAISNSGSSQEVVNIMPPIKSMGCPIVAITGNKKSPLAKEADYILDVNVEHEACPMGLAPTTSTSATLLMGDALVICLIDRRGFKAENYALYHPGGALGRRLLSKVKNYMRTEIPRVNEDSPMRDIVYEVSSKRLGMTMVYGAADNAVGIITDGDIRRAMCKYGDSVMSIKAADFMTSTFKRIAPEAMVNDALEMMDLHKITNIAVVNGNEVIGVIAMHDIMEFR